MAPIVPSVATIQGTRPATRSVQNGIAKRLDSCSWRWRDSAEPCTLSRRRSRARSTAPACRKEERLSFPLEAIAVFAVVVLGSSVQASLGFGLGLVAAPLLLLIDSRLVPGPLMASGIVLTLRVAYRERDAIDFAGLRFALGGRILGTFLAALVWTTLTSRTFDLLFGGLVMLAIALSASGLRVSPSPGTATGAGALSGFMGTLSSIGGPPMALLYQGESAARLRSTLSGYFVIGALISLTALAAVGRYGKEEILLSVFLIPAILVGDLASGRMRSYVDGAGVKPFILALSFLSAAGVLYRALV
jgi:uncharacterized membrane protein YfcA